MEGCGLGSRQVRPDVRTPGAGVLPLGGLRSRHRGDTASVRRSLGGAKVGSCGLATSADAGSGAVCA